MPRWIPNALHAAGWLALLPMLGLCGTLWLGIDDRRTIAAFQALTPWVLVWAAPLAVVAALARRHALALTTLLPLVTLLVLSAPIVFHSAPPAAASGSPSLSIAYSNVLYSNTTPAAAAATLLAQDADVLVLVEFAAPVSEALLAAVPEGDYRFREEAVNGGAGSIAIWSRHTIVGGGVTQDDGWPIIDVTLDVEGSTFRVIGVHPHPPTFDAPAWRRHLALIGDRFAASTMPTAVVGDFNGSRWHPSFRALLDRGLTDAHEALGRGWTVSWPMDEGLLPPTFVRIDHALYGDGLTPTALHDLEVPGSDHKGFVVTFALTA